MKDESLSDFLNSIGATSDVVQQGFRLYLAELTDDLPPSQMEQILRERAADEVLLDEQLTSLKTSSPQLELVALYFLTEAWGDPLQRESIREALREANSQLPIIEVALLSLVAMYGMYLVATRGKASSKRQTTRAPDGSFTESEETQYANPGTWVKGLVGIFGAPPP